MKKLSEAEIKVLSAWAIFGVSVFLIILLINFNGVKKENEIVENITAGDTKHLVDRNKYYTVKGAITKYYSFINNKDDESVLKILNEKYVKKNNITKDNLNKHVAYKDINVSYKPGIICVKSVKKGVYTYVVEGYELASNTGKKFDNVYYKVVLNGNTSLYSIEPIESKDYKEGCNE